jgi:16S rRNA G966 N2-methylase RsmD
VRTIGFAPSCQCNANIIPGTVLDPFGGSGTTGLVADRLGRNAILIELNQKYAAMAQNRITDDAPLFAEVELSA